MLAILGWIIFGLIAGLIAKAIMPGRDPGGVIITILLGIAGADSIRSTEQKVADLLRQVGLSPDMMRRYPHAFSGGALVDRIDRKQIMVIADIVRPPDARGLTAQELERVLRRYRGEL